MKPPRIKPLNCAGVSLLAASLALAGGLLPAAAAPAADPPRPSILFAIADDLSWLHVGAYGDRVVKTPALDRLAREGVRFTHAFCSSPSCTPSRGAILAGQDFFRLREGGNLWSTLPRGIEVYPDLLEAAGYHVGFQGKGWGPGKVEPGGRSRNPAGPGQKSFREFLSSVPAGRPFCFWFGSQNPHRPYEPGSGARSGLKPEEVQVPPIFPDAPEVRGDLLDYYLEVQRFDGEVARLLETLDEAGKARDTLVVVTSDNGMPFPRAKTNLYDHGVRLPLIVRWPGKAKGGRTVDDFVGFADFAPTFLEAAGLKPGAAMTGRSFLGLLTAEASGRIDPARDRAYFGRERHTIFREGQAGYPMRGVRTHGLLYIQNLAPGRWPAGDPEVFGDIDGGPTKRLMMEAMGSRGEGPAARLFDLAFGKRPGEELYDVEKDPHQLKNVASDPAYAAAKAGLRADLERFLKDRGDPRSQGGDGGWDRQPYYGKKEPGDLQVKPAKKA